MIAKVIFFSAAAYLAYRYIGSSNRKAKELNNARGTVEILPPAAPSQGKAAETLRAERPAALLSAAAEDLRGK